MFVLLLSRCGGADCESFFNVCLVALHMKPANAILELIAQADQKSLEKVFSIAICRQSGDK